MAVAANRQDSSAELPSLETLHGRAPRFSLLEEEEKSGPRQSGGDFYGISQVYAPKESTTTATMVTPAGGAESSDREEGAELHLQEPEDELGASVKETVCGPGETEKQQKLRAAEPFGESFEEQSGRVRAGSPYGGLKTWRLAKLIVKKGCDLRQEQFAMQLISQIDQIFRAAKLKIWLKTYEILCTGPNCGLVECVQNAVSLDALNKKLLKLGIRGLGEFFMLYYPTQKRTCDNNPGRAEAGTIQLRGLLGGLLACLLHTADQGPAQRQHLAGSRGSHRPHRLRFPY